ncbi:unnamed protein product, partial [Amoebophrya sp. A25]|eukprot:GSA25T00022367001.1
MHASASYLSPSAEDYSCIAKSLAQCDFPPCVYVQGQCISRDRELKYTNQLGLSAGSLARHVIEMKNAYAASQEFVPSADDRECIAKSQKFCGGTQSAKCQWAQGNCVSLQRYQELETMIARATFRAWAESFKIRGVLEAE